MTVFLMRLILVFGFLSAIYVGLVVYQRWDTRKTLEEEYAAGAAPALSQEDYVARGLMRQERSLKRRALAAIFLLPAVTGTILAALALLT